MEKGRRNRRASDDDSYNWNAGFAALGSGGSTRNDQCLLPGRSRSGARARLHSVFHRLHERQFHGTYSTGEIDIPGGDAAVGRDPGVFLAAFCDVSKARWSNRVTGRNTAGARRHRRTVTPYLCPHIGL